MILNFFDAREFCFDAKFGVAIYKKDKPGESQITLCDNKVAKKLLNWRPIINFKRVYF